MPQTRRIRLVCAAHVYYTHKDIVKARGFLEDFGLEKLSQDGPRTFYKGTGAAPFVYCAIEGPHDVFGGAAFVVESMEDLEIAAATLPNATPVKKVTDEPGGGLKVTFEDPVDHFPFHLVYGQKLADDDQGALPELDFNFPKTKHRPANKSQRFEKGAIATIYKMAQTRAKKNTGPAPVHKLGHFGLVVTDFAKMYDFFTSRFNFKASNLVYDDSGRDITTFLHLDLGKELVDHHCFFFFEGPKPHVHHSSFETHDFDTQLLGHDWLREKGYENCWGVGRHVMGSQIFDYWFDPSRFILEHYVDGDLVDETYPTHREKAAPGNLHVWGPEVPAAFLS